MMIKFYQNKRALHVKSLLRKLHRLQLRIKALHRQGELTAARKQQLVTRLRRYAYSLRRIGNGFQRGIAAGALALALSMAAPVYSQETFEERTGSDNPFSGVPATSLTTVATADIDGDGDLDLFVGDYIAYESPFRYFQNVGTDSNPEYEEQFGPENPLNQFVFPSFEIPSADFADIDDDGDLDVIVGFNYDGIAYYRNDGTATEPIFAAATSTGLLDDINSEFLEVIDPVLEDFDGDGDLDLIIGVYVPSFYPGTAVRYYRNEGSASEPLFELVPEEESPFDNSDFDDTNFHSPILVDLDQDGDLDGVIGTEDGLFYFENQGSATEPDMQMLTIDSPFAELGIDNYVFPEVVDLDNDGDQDVILGRQGTVRYFENTRIGGGTVISFANLPGVCIDSGTQSIVGGASPAGGVYSGPGVTDNGNGVTFDFDPLTAGIGVQTISYTLDELEAEAQLAVFELPELAISLPEVIIAVGNVPPVNVLGTATPEGGIYSSVDGSIIDDGNGTSFSFIADAELGVDYTVVYTFIDENGCENTVDATFLLDMESSVDSPLAAQVVLAPNPVGDVLHFRGITAESIEIMDLHGRSFPTAIITSGDVEVSGLPAGNYLLRIRNGEETVTKRFVKI